MVAKGFTWMNERKILLYANDMAMCSNTVGRIQKMIDVLGQFCEK